MFAEADGPSKLKPEKSLRFSNFWDSSPRGWVLPLINSLDNNSITSRSFTMANPGLIKNALKRESWETLDGASTTNVKYNGLLGVITYHIKTICPKLKRIIKPKKNRHSHSQNNWKNSSFCSRPKKVSRDKSIQRQSKIHKYEKTYDTEIKQAKRDFVNERLTKAPINQKKPGKS